MLGCGYYRLGNARVKLQQVTEVVQIKQTRAFILPFLLPLFDAKQNTDEPRSAQVNLNRIPNCMCSSFGKTGSLEDIKRFLVKYTHARTHIRNCTHRQPCLGQRGAQALIMSGIHERVAPHEKTNFASGAVVSRLTSEPLSGHIVPRWIPSDSPSLNSTVSISQSESSTGNLLGKLRPLKGLKNLV